MRVAGCGLRVSGFGFRVSDFGFRVSGFGFWISGFGFRVSGFGLGIRTAKPAGIADPAEAVRQVGSILQARHVGSTHRRRWVVHPAPLCPRACPHPAPPHRAPPRRLALALPLWLALALLLWLAPQEEEKKMQEAEKEETRVSASAAAAPPPEPPPEPPLGPPPEPPPGAVQAECALLLRLPRPCVHPRLSDQPSRLHATCPAAGRPLDPAPWCPATLRPPPSQTPPPQGVARAQVVSPLYGQVVSLPLQRADWRPLPSGCRAPSLHGALSSPLPARLPQAQRSGCEHYECSQPVLPKCLQFVLPESSQPVVPRAAGARWIRGYESRPRPCAPSSAPPAARS